MLRCCENCKKDFEFAPLTVSGKDDLICPECGGIIGKIYPTEESMKALTVFQIYEGTGEWFDLSKKPIERASFNFGKVEIK